MSQFPNQNDAKRNTITLPATLRADLGEAFTAESQTWMLLPVEEHVFDFKAVLSLSPNLYVAFTSFVRTIRKSEKKVFSINMSAALQQQISSAGMKDLFAPKDDAGPSPAAATPPPAKGGAKIDVAFINPFLNAVKEVFGTQANTKITPGRPFLANPTAAADQPAYAIVGLVALNSGKFRGNIALCFPNDVFLKIYERMLGEKHTAITREIEDGVAELLNIIYGTAKTVLNKDQGLDLKPALPTVLTGERIVMRRSPDSQVLVLPFDSEAGMFHVEIVRVLSAESEKRSA